MKYVVTVNGRTHEVTLEGERVIVDGNAAPVHLSEIEGTPVSLVTVGSVAHRVVVRRGDARGRYTLSVGGYRYQVEALDERTRAIRELSGATGGPAGPEPLHAPMPGLVVRVSVQVGDTVHPGQGLVVMEAMKMENELRATASGTVKRVAVEPGQAVERGAVLVELE